MDEEREKAMEEEAEAMRDMEIGRAKHLLGELKENTPMYKVIRELEAIIAAYERKK